QVPCGTCTKRGLQSLCPDGQLSSTKGSRYVLASAEESWQRIQALCVRVQDLEFALERAHAALVASNPSVAASTSGSTNRLSSGGAGSGGSGGLDRHPLLDPELIKIGQDPRAVMIGKSSVGLSPVDGLSRGSLSAFTGTGGPNDVPVAQMGTMKLSKSGSFRWMATTALPGMVLDAFGDGVPEQDFEHAVSSDQYPDHHHSHSHHRQGSFSSVSYPFPGVGEPDATSPITPTNATTMGGGAATTNTTLNTATHFISSAFGPTSGLTQSTSGPLSFASIHDLKSYAICQLPSSQQALHLIDTYFQFSWHWPIIISRQTVIDTLYTPAYATPSSSSTPSTSSNPLPQHSQHQQQTAHHGGGGGGMLADSLSAYQLASLFSILAMGALYDPTSDATCTEFKTRRKIARALFFATSTFAYSNAVAAAAVVASSGPSAASVSGNGAVACKLGMHNDPEQLNLAPEEANRRRRVFWALWFHDSLMSLNFGQPPTLTKGFVNCQPPRNSSDHGEDLHPRLTIVIQDLLRHFMESGPSPPYSSVLLLDRKIREIDPMKHAEPIHDLLGMSPMGPSSATAATASANTSSTGAGSTTTATVIPEWRRELANAFSKGLKYMLLMSLHKTYFSYALLRPDENTDTGKLALSISAMYEGATGLLECAQITSRNASWLQARYSPSWIHYQTSCMVLYAFPMYLPSSPKAEEAMKTADLAVSSLFQAHGRDCGVAAAGLPSLLKCQEKAKASMATYLAGQWTHPMVNKEAGATSTTAGTTAPTVEEGLPTEVFFNEKLVITSTASPVYNPSHGSRGSTPSDMMATASPSNFESNLGGHSGGTDGGHAGGGASGSVFGGESSCSSSAFQSSHWISNGIDSPIIVSPDAGPASFSGPATGSYFSPAPTGSSADVMNEERMEDPTTYGRSQPMEWSNAAPIITKVETPPPPPINMMYGTQQMYSPQSQVPPSNLLQVPSPVEDYPAPAVPVRRVRGLSRARSFPSDHMPNIYPPISSVSPHMYQPMVSPHSFSPHSISPPTPSTLTPSQHGVYSLHHHQTTHTPPPQISHAQRPSHHHHDSYGQWIGHTIPDTTGYNMAPTMHYASPPHNHHQLYPHHRHSQPSLHTLPQQSFHGQSPQGDHIAPAIPIHLLEQSWNNFSGQQR
ncbi:hypothetical protein FRC20_008814, partial [Serendipita sp. 405]